MGFTRTKDRVWAGYNVFADWLAHRPMPVRKAGYGLFGAILWTAYRMPGNKIRPTIAALAGQVGARDPNRLFRDFTRGFTSGINRIEQVRHGLTDDIDTMLRIPEQAKLDALLARGGVVLAIPHTHASLAMGRGLARKYPILALVRSTVNDRRAASEREIYEHLGCEWLDIRLEPPTIVARKVLGALNKGRLVVGTVDRLQPAPPEDAPVNARTKVFVVRVTDARGRAGQCPDRPCPRHRLRPAHRHHRMARPLHRQDRRHDPARDRGPGRRHDFTDPGRSRRTH